MRSIPRKDFQPSKHSRICSLHFSPDDFCKDSMDTNPRRTPTSSNHKPRLKTNAVPRIYADLPSYLSLKAPKERPDSATSTTRELRQKQDIERKEREKLAQDSFSTLADLASGLSKIQLPEDVGTMIFAKSVMFAKITARQEHLAQSFVFYLVIEEDLSFSCALHGNLIPYQTLSHISGNIVTSFNAVSNILAFIQSMSIDEEETTVRSEKIKLCILSFTESLSRFYVQDEECARKLSFLLEQLNLVFTSPHQRRYSKHLLILATLWKTTSRSLYNCILQDKVLTLPSTRRLSQLTEAISIDTGMSNSSLAYLAARFSKLREDEKMVTLMIDEVYSAQRVEYSNGKFSGTIGDVPSKTILCFMISSAKSKYKDMVSLCPIDALDAKLLHSLFLQALLGLEKVGFHVLAISVDNLSVNRKFYHTLAQGQLKPWIPHPTKVNARLYLLFDTVHIFKCIYNNFVEKGRFLLPGFDDSDEFSANMEEVKALYDEEMGQPARMGHKLSHKVLSPSNIDKSNVQLGNSLFHESTIAGLKYNGFQDTAKFLELIRTWWNVVNTKTTSLGVRKMDETRKPIKTVQSDAILFLDMFADWINEWHIRCKKPGYRQNGLTRETFESLYHTSMALRDLATYLLTEKQFHYVLLGQFQSDPLEQRFGIYRRMGGCNYFVSVRQILEAEKTIRLKSLLQFSGFDLVDAKSIFQDNDDKVEEEKSFLTNELISTCLDRQDKLENNYQSIIYYIAGYAAKSVGNQLKCKLCAPLLIQKHGVPQLRFSQELEDNEILTENSLQGINEHLLKEEFTLKLDQGGLCYPSELVFATALSAWDLFTYISEDPEKKPTYFHVQMPGKLLFLIIYVFYKSSTKTKI